MSRLVIGIRCTALTNDVMQAVYHFSIIMEVIGDLSYSKSVAILQKVGSWVDILDPRLIFLLVACFGGCNEVKGDGGNDQRNN